LPGTHRTILDCCARFKDILMTTQEDLKTFQKPLRKSWRPSGQHKMLWDETSRGEDNLRASGAIGSRLSGHQRLVMGNLGTGYTK